ncbi:Chondroitin polymerase [Cecembia lonarensis LW9]|uniref:Chondroitin polymerase n=2 Tax=Cecembia TaxID=1187078 RepID=K1M549_CECL9|nr:Chondroitin polymerase [Cecembia lonarensis LW9]
MTFLSVVMPVYNGEKHLVEAIESVLNQSFGNFELIIIDDASTDQSVEIIRSFADARIRLLQNEQNSGVAATRNRGLQEAKGEYLVWMDCDDIIDTKKFEIQVNFLNQNPEIGICGTWLTRFGEGRPRLSKSPTDPEIIKASLIFNPSVWNATAMFRMDKIKNANLSYDTRLKVAEDYNFYFDASHHFPMKNIAKSLYHYRASDSSIMKKFGDQEDKMLKFYQIIYTKVFDALAIEKTEENFLKHRKIASTQLYDNWKEFKIAHHWLLSLIGQNEKIQLYDQKAFEIVINDAFFFLCKKSSQMGLKIFFYYIKHRNKSLPKDYNLFLRLFIRCLILYKKF